MDINKLTEKLREALSSAQSTAVRYNHQQVDVEHLLLALLEQERGLARSILNKANVDVDSLRRTVEQELDRVKREFAQVKLERDILKKAAPHLAKDSPPGTR